MPTEIPICALNSPSKEYFFRVKHKKFFKRMAKKTHFNYREVEALSVIYRKVLSISGPMTRSVFRDIFHSGLDFTENIRHLLIDRIFSTIDKTTSLQIRMGDWIEALSIILRGSLDERIHFAYKVYDLLKTNRLKKEQMFPLMRGCLIAYSPDEDPDDGVKDLIDLVIKKIDIDRDGYVSEEDFCTAVKEKGEFLLECMGPVFPSRDARHSFLTTFTDQLGPI
ncbi:PREDICTED: EF-hand calcium-binding domain-containing protein 1-like [Polistes dominula]|uniref:EF-hand calcium-binding domain-containing protein 1-like n=1 Tax=Polistes dominula TaxID=743375 RepID=A0ABM1J8J2_POLDO|nr:PREDICTED: EF-hand calcium-binding domain-containing protein 1-like [Polistes dominula]